METNAAKGISVGIFILVSLVMGTLPLCLVNNRRIKTKFLLSVKARLAISFLNCFAGGVFLGACLLNLLLKGQEEFAEYRQRANVTSTFPFFELAVGSGLLLIALLETGVHACMSRHSRSGVKSQDRGQRDTSTDSGMTSHNDSCNPGGVQAVSSTTQTCEKTTIELEAATELPDAGGAQDNKTDIPHKTNGRDAGTAPEDHNGEILSEVTLSTDMASLRALLLVMAMSLHAVFDGLAVGLMVATSDVWSVAVGISVHKAVVAFCLGLKLTEALPCAPAKTVLSMFVFSCMTPLGVAIGVGVTVSQENAVSESLSCSLLQALATGVFLYVTFFEVLGPELAVHQGHRLKALKIAVSALGFGAMAGVKVLDKE